MRQTLKELTDLLAEQKGALSSILELSREEQRIIINGEDEKLEDVVRLKFREVSKLGAIEKKRAGLHKSIASEFNIPGNDVTVSAIAGRAAPDECEVITKLQTELIGMIRQHTDINKGNRELIKARLEYTEAMLEMLVDSEDPLNNFYGCDGKAAPDRKKTTGFFNGHA
jgi:flagellar biosynthesis/type III secretory pathway chaperone